MAEHGHKTNKNRKYDRNRKRGATVYTMQGRLQKNKRRKLVAHCARHPEDKNGVRLLERNEARPVRQAPQAKVWDKASKRFAQMLRKVGCNGNAALDVKHCDPLPTKPRDFVGFPVRHKFQKCNASIIPVTEDKNVDFHY